MPDREPEYRRRRREKAAQDKEKADNERDKAATNADQNEIIVALKTINEKLERAEDKQSPQNKREFWLKIAEVSALSVAAAVGAIAIVVGNHDASQQRGVMQSQLDIMAADQRPWVSIEQLSISSGLAYDDVGWQSGKRWHITLTYTLKNYGKTPATHVMFWAHIVPIVSHYRSVDGTLHGSFIGDDLNAVCGFPEGMTDMATDAGQLMFPGDEWSPKTFEVQGDEKPFAEAKAAKPQYGGIFLIPVCVTYRSAYANIRGIVAVLSGAPSQDGNSAILGNDHYRTAEGWRLGKRSRAAINLDGEVVGEPDLVLGEPGFQATSVK